MQHYDLATDKDGDLPSKPEKSERALMKVMRRCQKPIALFIDDGHDLHAQTLRSLKQFIEKTRHRGGRLTLVLAGHPRLKNELRRGRHERGHRGADQRWKRPLNFPILLSVETQALR
jgi:type II secretory pathway predicted ATPase ExeA